MSPSLSTQTQVNPREGGGDGGDLDPPKSTAVSISPSGSVLEGSSVTLTCSSNGNPPVQHYTWYKVNGREMNTVGTGQDLTFNVTESSGSEQYYCEAQNQHGKENSTTVQLEVDYPPKNTSVFVSPSGSVLEGSSVTLTCSSNANPPVQNYTWYKVNGREMNTVGTGQHLTFNVTESSGSEQYYCEAQNEHGKENSPTVQLEVDYMPRISDSGSCNRTAAEISCSCESRGNPSPSMEWRVSGLRVTNSTDRVISEEQLGNTGLRSSLTMRHSQGDTPTLLCLSTNTVGSSSLRLLVPSPQQHSGQVQTSDETEEPTGPAQAECEHKPLSLGPPSKSGEDLYANLMVARKRKEGEERGETEAGGQNQTKTQSQAADDTLHYASVKFIKRKSNPEAAAVTNPVYDNASCDTNRKDGSSDEFDPSPAGAATE
ncbi:hypothetical protein SKAU_G00418620 [Synaphobranchus kaupii]|uniref:Ig-like domain-containing protein n=1 Tax=Synaphobranchus kaupii TaxID=118154 RepID=A0A9Q1E674_SYNKA|nr:hypothetical protein SKAU_G00418620 [Synaphobranchus kaupii]